MGHAEKLLGRGEAVLVRNGVARLQAADLAQRQGLAAPGDDQPLIESIAKDILQRPGHGCGGLARAKDDDPAEPGQVVRGLVDAQGLAVPEENALDGAFRVGLGDASQQDGS